MTELRRSRAPLAGIASAFLFIWFFISARNFGTSLGGSIPLTAIDQLRGHNLV
jgi:hypothetical protein